MRKTHALVQVLQALMDDPMGRHWGYELGKRAGVRSGVLYPILHRMLNEGWLDDGWEEADETSRKRPARRYYELTPDGRAAISALLVELRDDARFASFLPGAPA
ncbi:MAG TPA: helix-turn-helix transcriptional regulator [Acidimicrobiales bacterium]|nr:helix-turn-helix transcriptional regulator [Acidimicrobiales bacterium]